MIYLLCGKVGSGKTTFAQRRLACPCLSCDKLLLWLFPPYLGDRHGEIQAKCTSYLMELAAELGRKGVDVALDFGFWTRQSRTEAKSFFAARSLSCALYFLDPPEQKRLERLRARDAAIESGEVTGCYRMDGGLREIMDARFEPPSPGEIDVWVGV